MTDESNNVICILFADNPDLPRGISPPTIGVPHYTYVHAPGSSEASLCREKLNTISQNNRQNKEKNNMW